MSAHSRVDRVYERSAPSVLHSKAKDKLIACWQASLYRRFGLGELFTSPEFLLVFTNTIRCLGRCRLQRQTYFLFLATKEGPTGKQIYSFMPGGGTIDSIERQNSALSPTKIGEGAKLNKKNLLRERKIRYAPSRPLSNTSEFILFKRIFELLS